MIDAPNATHSGEEYTARAKVLRGLPTDALPQAINDPWRPNEQMYTYGQGTPGGRVSSYGHPSSHDQVPPHEYFSPASTSYMTPGSQFDGVSPQADRPTHPMSLAHNGSMSSHLASPASTAYTVAQGQPYEPYLTGSNRFQFPEANSPLTLAPYVASPMAPECESSISNTILRQPIVGQDQFPLLAANARASMEIEEFKGVPRHRIDADEAMGGSMSIASLDQDLAMLDAEVEDELDSEQQRGIDRGESATMPGNENDVEMVDKYAFNNVCEAYDHRVPQQLTNGITIHVGSLAAITTSLKQHREETGKRTAAAQEDVIPPQVPHPNEYQKGRRTFECVWIGMLPSPAALLQIRSKVDQPSVDAAGEGSPKKSAKKRSRKGVMVAGLTEAEMQIIDFDPNALRVVAKKWNKATRDTHIYALLNPDNVSNLCHGFKVCLDDVFYFREFRDDITRSIVPRRKSTVTKIRASVFPIDAPGVSQSPVPTNGQPSSRAMTTMASPSPRSVLSITRHLAVASRSPRIPAKELIENTRSSSEATPHKNQGNGENVTSRKRKARHSITDVLMKQRDENRRKARAEGYHIPASDSEPHESVEDDDRDTPADRVEGTEGESSMNLRSDCFADVEEPGVLASSAAEEAHWEDGLEGNVHDEAFPEHAIGAEDPRFLRYTDDLVRSLSRGAESKPNGPKTLSFQGKERQMIDQKDKAVPIFSFNREGHNGYDADNDSQDVHAAQQESASLAKKIKDLANELATKHNVVGLEQALTMMQCLQNRCAPPKTSILGLYLNVPKSKDISTEDCATQLEQLRALFKGLGDNNEIHDHVLAWMIKGLQTTGQSLSIDLLYPCLITFAKQYKSKFGDSPTNRMLLDVLVDMTCCARTTAEETLRFEAIVNGANRATLGAEGECPSHPYIDSKDKFVYKSAVWERPE